MVALCVVYATKTVVEEPTPTPIVDEREESGIQQYIEANVLERNATWDTMKESDPRRLALNWILYTDNMQLTTLDDSLSQRYILALLAFSFDSPAWTVCGNNTAPDKTERNGDVDTCLVADMTGLEKEHTVWLSSKPECEWYGVTCDDDNRILGLVLKDNGLIGEIPPEIGKLNLALRELTLKLAEDSTQCTCSL